MRSNDDERAPEGSSDPKNYDTWQEGLAAEVERLGLKNSELGDISRRALESPSFRQIIDEDEYPFE